jgi:putative inorganic carbon (HCO3(-)) transporter
VAFIFFLVYLAFSYVYPADLYPVLAQYRIALWVGVAGLAVSGLEVIVKRRTPLATLPFALLAGFAILMAVSRMVSDRWLGAPVMVLQRFGPSLTMFVLAAWSVDSLRKLRVATTVVILLSMLLLIQGAAAYHFGYDAKHFLLEARAGDEDRSDAAVFDDPEYVAITSEANAPKDHVEVTEDAPYSEANDTDGPPVTRIRGLGLLHDPNDLAVGFVVALALLGGAWHAKDRVQAALLAIPIGALGYGVFLTRSRGGTLAFLVVLWRVVASRFGRLPAIVLTIALASGAAAMNFGSGRSLRAPSDEAASGRLIAWTEGLEMLKTSPILGIGYGQFLEYHTLTAHNSMVLCFAETGLLGYFFWVGLLVVTCLELQALKHLPDENDLGGSFKDWANVLQLSIVAFMTAAFFLSRTFVPMLYLLLGLSAALVLIARQGDRETRLPALPNLAAIVLACEVGSVALIYIIVKLHLA